MPAESKSDGKASSGIRRKHILVTADAYDAKIAMFSVMVDSDFLFTLSCEFDAPAPVTAGTLAAGSGASHPDDNDDDYAETKTLEKFDRALYTGTLASQIRALSELLDISLEVIPGPPMAKPSPVMYKLTSLRGLESPSGFLMDQYSIILLEEDVAMIFAQMRYAIAHLKDPKRASAVLEE